MSGSKPIRVFFSPLSRRFYATRAYKQCHAKDGTPYVQVTGEQFDVTNDIARLIEEHDVVFRKIESDATERIQAESPVNVKNG